MRFFALLNFQHVILYIIPTIVFVIVLGVSLGFSHFKGSDSEERMKTITGRYPEGIEERNAPFPVALLIGASIDGQFAVDACCPWSS